MAYINGNQILFSPKVNITEETVVDSGKFASLVDNSITELTADDLKNVSMIEQYKFYYCRNLQSITFPTDHKIVINDHSFYGTGIKELVIPANVYFSNHYQFTYNQQLEKVTFLGEREGLYSSSGEHANTIHYMFSTCTALTDITLPQGLKYIYTYMFNYCTSLKNITLPESIIEIGNYAFYNCPNLKNITIPNGVTKIGYGAFKGCDNLTDITIPDGVTTIENETFYRCTSLANIAIPNSVTSIGSNVFSTCTALTDITIPNSVTSISSNVFYNCTSLTQMTVLPTTPPTLSSTNAISTATTAIYVPADSVDAYKTATNWSNFADIIFPIVEESNDGNTIILSYPTGSSDGVTWRMVDTTNAQIECKINGTWQLEGSDLTINLTLNDVNYEYTLTYVASDGDLPDMYSGEPSDYHLPTTLLNGYEYDDIGNIQEADCVCIHIVNNPNYVSTVINTLTINSIKQNGVELL